jgi:hypothetical protein
VHEQVQVLPAAWRQLYVRKAAHDGMLMQVQRILEGLFRHLQHAHTLADDEQEQQQQQEERNEGTNRAPPVAPAPPNTPAAGAEANAPAAAAAAIAIAQELAARCSSACIVLTEPAVLLVIEVMQLLAAASEQSDNDPRYDSLRACDQGACLLRTQLVLLRSHPELRDRRSSVVHTSAQQLMQLMQLMRWQLQLAAQRSTPPGGVDGAAWQKALDSISDHAKQMLFADDLLNPCSGV